jgi:hypothetical protein
MAKTMLDKETGGIRWILVVPNEGQSKWMRAVYYMVAQKPYIYLETSKVVATIGNVDGPIFT